VEKLLPTCLLSLSLSLSDSTWLTMDEKYDVIVLGTGLKECILSGLLSVNGHKVLHMDRNNYYGAESASLNLQQVYEKFRAGQKPNEKLGSSREFNVDLIPKFIMGGGNLVKLLIHTDVTRYLEFKCVDGSYVFKDKKINKVPCTGMEAAKSDLMGLLEKRRCAKFLDWVQNYDDKRPTPYEKLDIRKSSAREVMTKAGLEPSTMEFLGHAVGLYRDDAYLDQTAHDFVLKMQLYYEGLARYEKSPYIYPLYGLGELPQAFARLAAIYGGTYMLNKPVTKIVYNSAGEACGVQSEGETASCKFVVGDPSYFPDKVKKSGQVVRAICILSHPIPNTNNSESCQIIIPQKQVGRKSDIYISCVSFAHNVAPKGKYIALVSTTVESGNPEAELKPGLDLLGPVDERFVGVSDVFSPLADGTKDKCFISDSFDATSHFETATEDVLSMYKRITGKAVDLESKVKTATAGEQ